MLPETLYASRTDWDLRWNKNKTKHINSIQIYLKNVTWEQVGRNVPLIFDFNIWQIWCWYGLSLSVEKVIFGV